MNRKGLTRSLFAVLVFSLLNRVASARPVKMWSFEELNDSADLVVVGTALSSADTKGHVYPNAKGDTWISVDTKFTVNGTLKGNPKGDTLTVRHLRFFTKKGIVAIVNGPSFVKFNPKLKNRYLIFLKRTEDGVYEPLTGQFDPDGSFFLLNKYHVTKENEPAGGDRNKDAK